MKHRVTPSAAVTAAVTYLLNQPDAAEFRKKHQALITPALAPGRHSDDYTPADTFALNSARRRARELGDPDPTIVPTSPDPDGDDSTQSIGRHGQR